LATWIEIANANLKAAKILHRESEFRSSATRSYYAAYAAVTAKAIERGVQFPYGGNNPTHEQLPNIILNNLNLSLRNKREAAAIIRRLRAARVSADYVPHESVDENTSRESLKDAARELSLLEVPQDDPT
jgi:uncharacterized protein (UPF0332 family)